VKGIIFGKNIPIECRDYPTHKLKEFRVLILTIDLGPLFHCRKNPSKKALLRNQKNQKPPHIYGIHDSKKAGI
jgi:hypothetical protein